MEEEINNIDRISKIIREFLNTNIQICKECRES